MRNRDEIRAANRRGVLMMVACAAVLSALVGGLLYAKPEAKEKERQES